MKVVFPGDPIPGDHRGFERAVAVKGRAAGPSSAGFSGLQVRGVGELMEEPLPPQH